MMALRASVLALLVIFAGWPGSAGAESYEEAQDRIRRQREELALRWAETADRHALVTAIERTILRGARELSEFWIGTRWGLGPPQSSTPGRGKINCGTFVGTILRDAGFVVNVKKLQRQPSQLIIKSFVGRDRMKKFSNAPMEKFLAEVREMGPGLYIIGLDFHVGFLVQTDTDLRFVHASYETERVVDEDAATAGPIVDSDYRVVGKILSEENVRDWLRRRRIRVKGKW